jgi:hypothetical protein
VLAGAQVTSQVTSSLDSFQLIAYLYDVNFLGIGTLISHGPRNVWRTGVPGQATQLDIVMRGLCVEIPKGHRIGLGLDMWSALYVHRRLEPRPTQPVGQRAAD